MRENGYLEFSCQSLEFSVNQGEIIQDNFVIYAGGMDAEGDIYSSDTRMQVVTSHFCGEETVVEYCFDGSFIEAGGTAIQYNVLDAETLRDAQKNPEKYPNLQVRVCGWNATFISLTEKEQNEFIAEAEA